MDGNGLSFNCHCVLVPGVLLPGERLDEEGNVVSTENDTAMLRQTKNTGVFSALPERMSKKHVRQVAAEYGIDLKGVTLFIDEDPEKLKPTFMITGRADAQSIGRIDLMPKAFLSREELTKTLFHEKIHVDQFKRYGAEFVQNNRIQFEQEAYEAEENFIRKLREDGRL